MKALLFPVAICLALSSPMLHAASKDPAASQSASKTQSPDTAGFDKNLARFQEQMKTMQAQMDQIRKTHDPKERQKLLQQHWATMQSAMTTMHGMWGPGMMGHGMMGQGMMGGGWSHMGGYYSGLSAEQLRQRQYMTDQYLQMQQEMMNNLMWQQQFWMEPPSSPQ
ncbi:hypothetical protein PPMP20_02785 [Paraburkholderia phymatum]|uniref:Conserved secreted protein with internal repeats n=1 Tax=Paraburkholderia phymatum (strain DSM 17167 / CIP 108236 / LMG 21445 / STM815) TaxID=391038 RepID=B2JWN5_PARP8|nr:hypothetical protein [Paraburkholderia phymatum]ACC75362.1 conserved secreted protein with internal repeats [Paraburkholderia phymatum STM815]